ncbi:glycosyltransferase family 4 protein [Microcoleus sp. FACHB-SPT15]|uniref:glycosyltransferase family 4 protein n=1 Tax=Microcoleus sp. FACHB-SPT15 TaxID=2692830 RepID=UPI00177CE836|nr:glycosyltransferase family 4 protein [Microcoleus sp. FACHB-SPT15]MBD1806552.1 glycosyltransferase family 4 protein [Microcoleus sp. FACHB-SPT15]
MRLTLVISSLSSGGAERVMSIMANYWVAKKWKITILTFDDGTKPPFYDLDSRVCHIPLSIAGESSNLFVGIWKNLKRIQILQSAIANSNPDAVISFMDQVNVLTLLAIRFSLGTITLQEPPWGKRSLKIPVIVSERIDPALYSIGRIWEQLRRWTYPFADHLVVQTQGALTYFSSGQQKRACIIPNPVVFPTRRKNTSGGLWVGRSLFAMGRLTRQKGFDLLLQAFARLKDHYPEWTLTILGEGELRTELESLRESLGLSSRVHLPGVVRNPYEVLMQAEIFVMSSRFEGFPNALCEAMACGVPVISSDCPSGPREIIRDGVDGILVPNQDVEALTAAMDRLMSDEGERKRLSSRAPEVVERFSLEKVMSIWEKLLAQVVEERL